MEPRTGSLATFMEGHEDEVAMRSEEGSSKMLRSKNAASEAKICDFSDHAALGGLSRNLNRRWILPRSCHPLVRKGQTV